MACKACRSRKIRCDRSQPVCQNCKVRFLQCTYTGERRMRRESKAGPGPDPLGTTTTTTPTTGTEIESSSWSIIHEHPGGQPGSSKEPQPQVQETHRDSIMQETTRGAASSASASASASAPSLSDFPFPSPWPRLEYDLMGGVFNHAAPHDMDMGMAIPQSPAYSDPRHSESLLSKILDGEKTTCVKDRNLALWFRLEDGDEYTGPSSAVSTLSEFGLDWVRQNVADSQALYETLREMRCSVISQLRDPRCIPQNLPLALSTPHDLGETPDALVSKYIDAYFDIVQVTFPILDRGVFTAQFAARGPGQNAAQSYSWQALLNAVLASGCRATLSDDTAEAFRKSGRESWGYFQNALSFEHQIFHGSTDLIGVQAVAVMTVFAQGLSSPTRLEYTLSSILSRIAQSLALNRHPSPDWNLSEEEQRERIRVFWVVYCLDRTISLRSGRAAVISDDDISCMFPRGVKIMQRQDEPPPPPSSFALGTERTGHVSSDVDFFLCFTKLARISGMVSRLLYSASALYAPSRRLLPTMNQLLQDLQVWLDIIPTEIRPGNRPNRMSNTFGLSRDQVIVLHLSYCEVLCAIYRRFTPVFTQDSKSLEDLLDRRSHMSHIEAARLMVLLTKHLEIESFSPTWLVFYHPFSALIAIFVQTVSNPPNESTQTDLALMETAVGFFGRIEYMTSGEATFTKTTEFVRHARCIISKYGKGDRLMADEEMPLRDYGGAAPGSNETEVNGHPSEDLGSLFASHSAAQANWLNGWHSLA